MSSLSGCYNQEKLIFTIESWPEGICWWKSLTELNRKGILSLRTCEHTWHTFDRLISQVVSYPFKIKALFQFQFVDNKQLTMKSKVPKILRSHDYNVNFLLCRKCWLWRNFFKKKIYSAPPLNISIRQQSSCLLPILTS